MNLDHVMIEIKVDIILRALKTWNKIGLSLLKIIEQALDWLDLIDVMEIWTEVFFFSSLG